MVTVSYLLCQVWAISSNLIVKGKIYHVACKKVCCKSRRSLEPTTTNQWFEYNGTYVMVWCNGRCEVWFCSCFSAFYFNCFSCTAGWLLRMSVFARHCVCLICLPSCVSPASHQLQALLRVQHAVNCLKQLNVFKDGMEVSLTRAKGKCL